MWEERISKTFCYIFVCFFLSFSAVNTENTPLCTWRFVFSPFSLSSHVCKMIHKVTNIWVGLWDNFPDSFAWFFSLLNCLFLRWPPRECLVCLDPFQSSLQTAKPKVGRVIEIASVVNVNTLHFWPLSILYIIVSYDISIFWFITFYPGTFQKNSNATGSPNVTSKLHGNVASQSVPENSGYNSTYFYFYLFSYFSSYAYLHNPDWQYSFQDNNIKITLISRTIGC